MSSVKDLVGKLIRDNNVMIFSKTYCPYVLITSRLFKFNVCFRYCVKAKGLFDKLQVKYNVIELDRVENGSAIQDELESLTHQQTVPNIFIKQKHVGGCDDVHALHNSGKLLPLLK